MTNVKNTVVSIQRHLLNVLDRVTGAWKPLLEERIPRKQMAVTMKAASIPTTSFFFRLSLSSAIASFGLLVNSAPAIIGAMIIAPLMTPLMGLSHGIVHLSWSQISRSAITVFLGMLVVVAIGYFSARQCEWWSAWPAISIMHDS